MPVAADGTDGGAVAALDCAGVVAAEAIREPVSPPVMARAVGLSGLALLSRLASKVLEKLADIAGGAAAVGMDAGVDTDIDPGGAAAPACPVAVVVCAPVVSVAGNNCAVVACPTCSSGRLTGALWTTGPAVGVAAGGGMPAAAV